MRMRGLAAAVAGAWVLAGCTAEQPELAPTVSPIPEEIVSFLAAASSNDLELVRERLAIWNEDKMGYLAADEISSACVEDEAAAVSAKVNSPNLDAYLYTGGSVHIVRFEAQDGSNAGWGIQLGDDGTWYWQPQAASCLALWDSPSPVPTP